MLVSIKHQFAFLCMPKCASTSIENAIRPLCNVRFTGPPWLKHMDAQDFHDFFLKYQQKEAPGLEIETFCMVRDPLDWIHSWYRYRQRDALRDPAHKNHRNYTGNVSFNQFIEAYIMDGERPPYADLQTQSEFLTLADGTIGVDVIFPVSRMDLVLEFLKQKTGQEIELPMLNQSPVREVDLDPGLRIELERYLARDIEIYQRAVAAGDRGLRVIR